MPMCDMPMTEDVFDLGVRARLGRTVRAGLEVPNQFIANTRRYTGANVDMLDLIEKGTSA